MYTFLYPWRGIASNSMSRASALLWPFAACAGLSSATLRIMMPRMLTQYKSGEAVIEEADPADQTEKARNALAESIDGWSRRIETIGKKLAAHQQLMKNMVRNKAPKDELRRQLEIISKLEKNLQQAQSTHDSLSEQLEGMHKLCDAHGTVKAMKQNNETMKSLKKQIDPAKVGHMQSEMQRNIEDVDAIQDILATPTKSAASLGITEEDLETKLERIEEEIAKEDGGTPEMRLPPAPNRVTWGPSVPAIADTYETMLDSLPAAPTTVPGVVPSTRIAVSASGTVAATPPRAPVASASGKRPSTIPSALPSSAALTPPPAPTNVSHIAAV